MDIAINLQTLQARYDEIAQQLASPSVDNTKRHTLQKEFSQLTTLLSKYKAIQEVEKQRDAVHVELDKSVDPAMKELYQEELDLLDARLKTEHAELENMLFPPDELDDRSVFLEIRAGAGGQEASLFAGDLARMYTNYALKKGWKVSIVSQSETDLGGFRELILHIEGRNVFGNLKHESGVHRVQRVPKTETQGRVHTSTATVAVMPEAEEVEFTINPADLRIDVYRASGAGGQHVNTTDSAVRITHIPTGVVVTCQDERSQHKNKATAMKMLQSRITAAEKEKQEASMSKQRKEQVGTGMRAEKVRTYNFPQNRVTDHQVDLTLKKLDMVIEGALEEIVQALMEKERLERKSRSLQFS